MSTSGNNLNYTDWYNVDEDMTVVLVYSGRWNESNSAGIVNRYLFHTSTIPLDGVASYVCEHHLLTLDGYHNVGHKNPY